jgi:multicomponent Na+:H+ antiporter subunit C
MALALAIGLLFGAGVFLVLRRGMLRIVVGFVLLTHGVNLLLVASGGPSRRDAPIGSELDPATTSDALPQAFVLTAVVIAFAVTVFLLVLGLVGDDDDDTEVDITGREMETPELLEPSEHARYRRHGPADYHAYLDRADDRPDADRPPEDDRPSLDGGDRDRRRRDR